MTVKGPIEAKQPFGHAISSLNRRLALEVALELFGSEEVDPTLDHILRAQDVNYAALLDRIGPICQRRIAFGRRLLSFELDELGWPGFIMAVHDINGKSVIDLVGWPKRRPQDFGTYFGYAGLLGGDAAVNPASFAEEPCPIWWTPISWLQSGARGCVVLDPHVANPILTQAPGQFQCEDAEHVDLLIDSGALQ